MSNKLSFFDGKKFVDVTIEVTNNKNLYLKAKNNQIVASVPYFVSSETIKKFIEENIARFSKYIDDVKANSLLSLDKNIIYYEGKKYTLKIIEGFQRSKVDILDDIFIVHVSQKDEEIVTNAIYKFFKKNLLPYIQAKQNYYENIMSVPQSSIKIIKKSGSWATNFLTKENITYSLKLGHFSLDVVDYVIVHELAHYFEPNHSKNFWLLVEKYYPNFKNAKQRLKANTSMDI